MAMLDLTSKLLFVICLGIPVAAFVWRLPNAHAISEILSSVVLAVLGGLVTMKLMPSIADYNVKAGLFGKDLNKPGDKENKPKIPESLGVLCGTVYIVCIILCQLIWARTANESILVNYDAALSCICFMTFLGFADDVMELPWRYKLILPTVASLPLLVAYSGGTTIVVPIPLRELAGKTLELGVFYKVYMGLLAVFCTNAINIYAGINGLEAGQSFVIACAVLTHNLIELSGSFAAQHLFSILLIAPFIAVTLGLLYYNWFPSKVFVGDTFTYFAGMTFAVTGILGHFSKTLLLFFIPQMLNFLWSLPQLAGIVYCPRHRLPKLNPKTGLLEPSEVVKDGVPQGITNMNLVNLVLKLFGPMSERGLCVFLLYFQVLSCAFAFFVRYQLASYVY